MICLSCSVHVTSTVCPSVLWEGSLLLGSCWGFFFLYVKSYISQYVKFFLTQFEGLRTEDDITVQVVKPTEARLLWFGAIKIKLIWFDLWSVWLLISPQVKQFHSKPHQGNQRVFSGHTCLFRPAHLFLLSRQHALYCHHLVLFVLQAPRKLPDVADGCGDGFPAQQLPGVWHWGARVQKQETQAPVLLLL